MQSNPTSAATGSQRGVEASNKLYRVRMVNGGEIVCVSEMEAVKLICKQKGELVW